MSEKSCTIRTRKFLTNRLLARKQFVSAPQHHLHRFLVLLPIPACFGPLLDDGAVTSGERCTGGVPLVTEQAAQAGRGQG